MYWVGNIHICMYLSNIWVAYEEVKDCKIWSTYLRSYAMNVLYILHWKTWVTEDWVFRMWMLEELMKN